MTSYMHMYTLSSVKHTHTQTHTHTNGLNGAVVKTQLPSPLTVIQNTSFEVIAIISHNSASNYMTNLLILLIKELLGDTVLDDLLRACVCLLLW